MSLQVVEWAAAWPMVLPYFDGSVPAREEAHSLIFPFRLADFESAVRSLIAKALDILR
jgi:hypothetical protein